MAAGVRIPQLLQTPAAVRFLSCEPLLGPVDLGAWIYASGPDLTDGPTSPLDWVIVGGESGPGARPMHIDWVRNLRDQSRGAFAFHFKQWGDASRYQDKHRDAWSFIGDSNLMETPETALFFRDHIERKWGPLKPLSKKDAGRELDGRTWDEYPA